MASGTSAGIAKERKSSSVHNHRFTCSNVETEWTLTDADGINYIISQLLFNGSSWTQMSQGIRKVQNVVKKNPQMSPVRSLLDQAQKTNNIKYLLHAYTLECDFYRILNKTLAERVNTTNMGNPIKSLLNLFMFDEDDQTPDDDWPLCFVGPIFEDIFSRNHWRYQFKGRTYRGARLSQSEIRKYVIGKLLFNKAFTSTSKQRRVAEIFTHSTIQDHKTGAIFTFIFNDNNINFTIDLKGISEFPKENEVLIMPGIPFRITKINQTNPIEIELEQVTINHLLGRNKNT